MGKVLITILAITVVAAWAVTMNTPANAGEGHMYIGVAKCKTCHKSEAQGEQFPIWEKSAHAGAYATLATDAAKKIAADKGIEDAQKADECLSCHVTAHGVAAEMLGPKYAATDGVGCESCHGPGGDYNKKKTMVAITTGEMDGAKVGMVNPTKETCEGCHNEKSPTFKGFDYDKMLAKIAHPIPEERKAKYEKAATE